MSGLTVAKDDTARTYLFVPGDKPALLEKAGQRGADALILDLEDAVAPSRKDEARAIVSRWLGQRHTGMPETWVRVNAGSAALSDISSLPAGASTGIVLPKVSGPEDVAKLASQVRDELSDRPLIVLIETAAAMRAIDEIAGVSGVFRLMIGEADLSADTGISPTSVVWDALRAQIVVASAAAGIASPIGPVDPDFTLLEDLEASTRHLRDLGFGARAVIHPAQIGPVHRGLHPTEQEVMAARRIVSAHNESLASGHGAYRGEAGEMIDEAFVRRARAVLAANRKGRAD